MRGEDQSQSSSAWLAVAGLVLVLPALYVLSLGPMIWLCPTGSAHIGAGPLTLRCSTVEPALRAFYAPLIVLHESSYGRRALDWWVDVWD
jgi:hypothetical protein